MERVSTFFLRGAVAAIAAVTLAFCIFALPALWMGAAGEFGVAARAVYGVVIAMYAAATPFWIGLYQAWRLLGFIDKRTAFSRASTKALQTVTYCAAIISVIFAVSLPMFYVWAQHTDAPGLIVIGMFFVGASLTVAVFATVLGRLFLEAAHIKSENDLTV